MSMSNPIFHNAVGTHRDAYAYAYALGTHRDGETWKP